MRTVTVIAVGVAGLSQLRALAQQAPWRERLQLELCYVGNDAFRQADWPDILTRIPGADVLLLDLMGAPRDFCAALAKHVAGYSGQLVVLNSDSMAIRSLTRLGAFSISAMGQRGGADDGPPSLDAMQRMVAVMERVGTALPIGKLRDMRNYLWLVKYWQFASLTNTEHLLRLLAHEYLGHADLPEPEAPQTINQLTICDPATRQPYADLRRYRAAFPPRPARPTVGLLFQHSTYPVDAFPLVSRLHERLRAVCNVIPIAVTRAYDNDLERLRTILAPRGRPQVDLLINVQSFRLGQGPMGGDAAGALALLRELDVPVLHPFVLAKRSVAAWQSDAQGAQVGEFLVSIFLPELDGCIEMFPIGAMEPDAQGFEALTLIDERVERLIRRAQRWTALRAKPNAEKRVALISYDYPPGEGNLGCGAFLDSFASLAAILQRLADEGYSVTPQCAATLRERMLNGGHVNDPQWRGGGTASDLITVAGHEYAELTSACPHPEQIAASWGPFPGDVMRNDAGVRLPGIVNRNLFLSVQPARGIGAQHGQRYHDTHLPPHHQYLAFYRWLEQVFQADVIIHVGTHGTLEFLPGKEKAVSGSCFPDYLIGDLPHLYLYYSGNPTEAMLAKRRAHATMISHLPPPFIRSELYGELAELRALCDEYHQAGNLDPARQSAIQAMVEQRVQALGWAWEGWEALEGTLYELESSLVPGGMHTFDRRYTPEEQRDYLVQVLRSADGERPALFELLCRERNVDWAAVWAAPHRHQALLAELEAAAAAWVQTYVLEERPLPHREHAARPELQVLHTAACAIRDGLQQSDELGGLVHALRGGYLPVGMGGDLFRSPEILPVGRNLVQFDPRRVPSPAAIERGAAIAAATLHSYQQIHGRYPRSVAVVLWGLETAKTQGETVGQILAYLGVRLVRRGGWETRLELVPLAELGRPRVDVTIQMCGFLRDMFPNLVNLIHEAIALLVACDEDTTANPIREHTRQLYGELREQGLEHVDAEEIAAARLFGPQSALYGAGVDQLIKSQAWRDPAELAACYAESLQYIYTPNRYGAAMPQLLTRQLGQVELISQVRSSRDYEITDLDHYYEFYGGLACSVKAAAGRQALLLVADTTEGRVRAEPMQRAVQRGLRTRLLNPRWLDGMLAHQYHGGQQIADRLEHMVGLAATTEAVDPALFEAANRCLIADDARRARIEQNNPYALLEVANRLLEAHGRGYWSASADDLGRLHALHDHLEDRLEGMAH